MIVSSVHSFSRKVFLSFLLLISISSKIVHGQELPPGGNQAELAKILEAAGNYCEKLKTVALHFICQENIKEKINEFEKRTLFIRTGPNQPRIFHFIDDLRIAKTIKNSYVYDYQMIKNGDDFQEKRALLEENGKKQKGKDVRLKTLRMTAEYLVFGPVGFLSLKWQSHFQYEIIGADKIGPREAIIIRAVPREITSENYCFGRIWIDKSEAGILQIEWEPQSIVNFKETVESPVGELRRKIAWVVAYDHVKNGIRFPGRQSIREIYTTKNEKEHLKYEAEYLYDHYKFFTVETEVVIK